MEEEKELEEGVRRRHYAEYAAAKRQQFNAI